MQNIILYAYDRRNLGDDLFIRTLVQRYPAVQFTLWSDKSNQKTFSDLNNLKVVDRESSLVKICDKISKSIVPRYKNWKEKASSAVVYIGGSIFIEYDSWPQVLNWWMYQAENHKLYILGANFGPYHSEEYRIAMADVFDKAQDVCFRDRYSYDLFREHKVRWAPDILFSYPMPRPKENKKQIFVSVINCKNKAEGNVDLSGCYKAYMSNIKNVCVEYLRRGYAVVLASFCKTEGDEDVIETLNCELHSRRENQLCSMYYNGSNWADMLESLAESEYVVASRFHAAILAINAGKPVFPIVYSDKTTHVLTDIGFDGKYADLRKKEDISFEIVDYNRQNLYITPASRLKKEALKHFALLDGTIKM